VSVRTAPADADAQATPGRRTGAEGRTSTTIGSRTIGSKAIGSTIGGSTIGGSTDTSGTVPGRNIADSVIEPAGRPGEHTSSLERIRASWRRPRTRRAQRRRRTLVAVTAVVALLLVPVPWKHVVTDDPPGSAWRLDGRLEIQGEMADPAGRWTWLAIGRPQLLGEVVWDQVFGPRSDVDDLRYGPIGGRPALNEPAAAAIGLQQAGRDIELGVLVEVRQPLLEGYPESGLLAAIDDVPLTDRETWERLSRHWFEDRPPLPEEEVDPSLVGDRELTFELRGGVRLEAPGPGLPYEQVHAVPTAPAGFEAGISFEVVRHLPLDGVRNLSLGRSHGLMVALVSYAHASGRDLAQGRHIAGTGGILGDGTVTSIGGLEAKARAANRAGADVLLVPRPQLDRLDDVPLDGTTLVPVDTLTEAIEWLAQPVA
jgi:hypothetical protein